MDTVTLSIAKPIAINKRVSNDILKFLQKKGKTVAKKRYCISIISLNRVCFEKY